MGKPGTYLSVSCPCAFCEAARKLGYKAWDYVEYEKVGCDQFGMKYSQEKEIPMSDKNLVMEWVEGEVSRLRKNVAHYRQKEEESRSTRLACEKELAEVESALACLKANGFGEKEVKVHVHIPKELLDPVEIVGPTVLMMEPPKSLGSPSSWVAKKQVKRSFFVAFKCGCKAKWNGSPSPSFADVQTSKCDMANGCFYNEEYVRKAYDQRDSQAHCLVSDSAEKEPTWGWETSK